MNGQSLKRPYEPPTIPPKPRYETELHETFDDNLSRSIGAAEELDLDYYVTLLTCELGSFRIRHGVEVVFDA